MASITVSREDLFPVGTSVGAYLALGLGLTPGAGAPPGDAAATSEVESDGSVTFTGLEDASTYILYAGSPDRYLRVGTPGPSDAASGGGGGGELGPGTVTVETLATDSLAALKAVAVHDGSSYPTRPLGFASVEWIGPTDPDELAEDGDTWVPTEAAE